MNYLNSVIIFGKMEEKEIVEIDDKITLYIKVEIPSKKSFDTIPCVITNERLVNLLQSKELGTGVKIIGHLSSVGNMVFISCEHLEIEKIKED